MADLSFSSLLPYVPEFLRGIRATVAYASASLCLACVAGLAVALARRSATPPLRWIAQGYVDLIRGTPALVQIFFIYFGLPAIGIYIAAPVAGIIAIGLNSAGYLAEIFRAGIAGVDGGQVEAGRSIGMSRSQTFRRVVLPQALRLAVPAAAGEFTSLVKGTSLLSTISITELTRVAQQVVSVTFRPIEAYLAVGLVYLTLNTAISRASGRLERALRRAEGLP